MNTQDILQSCFEYASIFMVWTVILCVPQTRVRWGKNGEFEGLLPDPPLTTGKVTLLGGLLFGMVIIVVIMVVTVARS